MPFFSQASHKTSSFDAIRIYIVVGILCALASTVGEALNLPEVLCWGLFAASLISFSFIFTKLKTIQNSIQNFVNICKLIEKGYLENRLKTTDTDNAGPLYELRVSMNNMADNVDAFLREARYATKATTQEQFHRHIIEQGMHGAFKQAAKLMNQTMTQAEERTKTIQKLIQTAGEGMTTIATSTEQSSSTITEINQEVGQSTTSIEKAEEQSHQVNSHIQSLLHNLKETNEVIQIVTSIAEQTNLLALNASIEAARAGSAGRGFSVVADEVRKLAAATGDATQRVSTLMDNIQTNVSHTQQSTDTMNHIIHEITENSNRIAMALNQQKMATEDIAQNSSEIISEMNQINQQLIHQKQSH